MFTRSFRSTFNWLMILLHFHGQSYRGRLIVIISWLSPSPFWYNHWAGLTFTYFFLKAMFLINSQILFLLCSFFRSPSCLTYGDFLPSSFKIILSLAFIFSILFLASVLVQFPFLFFFLLSLFLGSPLQSFFILETVLSSFFFFSLFLLPSNFGHIFSLYFLLLIFAFSLVFHSHFFLLHNVLLPFTFLYLSFNLFLSHLNLYAIFSFFFWTFTFSFTVGCFQAHHYYVFFFSLPFTLSLCFYYFNFRSGLFPFWHIIFTLYVCLLVSLFFFLALSLI